MPYTITEAILEDAPLMTSVFYDCFIPPAGHIFPDTPAGRQWTTDSFSTTLDSKKPPKNSITWVVLDTSSTERKVVAFARWFTGTFNAEGGSWQERWQDKPPEGVEERVMGDEFWDAMARQHAVATKDRPHYFLEVLCCLPDHRGQGLAGQLLKWGNDRADEKGWECYLDAAKKAEPLYEKWGYEHQIFRDPKSPSEPMRRPATILNNE